MFASKTTRGFYDAAIHGDNMPEDVVEISKEEHSSLLEGHSQGKVIDFDEAGFPFLSNPPPPAPDTIEKVQAKRHAAYVAESDPLKNEAEYDAIIAGTEPDYTAWLAKIAEIKARLPLP